MKLADMEVPRETLMLARLIDDVAFIAWTQTAGAKHNKGRPSSVLKALLKPPQNDTRSFHSSDDFMKARAKLLSKEGE